MPLLEWNDYYKVGYEKIDRQHKKLVDIANRVHDEYMRGLNFELHPRQALSEIIEELLEYTETHFKYEEELMEKAGYPDLEKHKKGHERLLLRVTQFKMDFDDGKADADDLVDFVLQWLTRHILGEDKKYIPYVQKLEAKEVS